MITKENFLDEWKKTDRKYRYSKKCVAIEWFVTTIGELLLAGSLIAVTYYAMKKNITELQMFMTYLGICVGLAVAICFGVTVLVHIVYHPFKTKYIEDAWIENARTMVEMSVNTRNNVKKFKKGISNVAWFLYILAAMIDTTAEQVGIWNSYIIRYMLPNLNMGEREIFILPIIELICLCLVHKIFRLFTRWMYFCPISYKEVLRAEEFRLEMEEKVSEKTEKEREILSDRLLEDGILALGRDEDKEAKDYFLKSALLGNVVGMDRLALLHANTEMDKEIASYWYKKCIKSGVATKDTKKHLRMVKNGIRVDNYY